MPDRTPPPVPNTANPYQVATLPANTQLQPDLVDQKYPLGVIPTMRVLPVLAAGNPAVNAAAKSIVVQEAPSSPSLTFTGENGITVSESNNNVTISGNAGFTTAGQGFFYGPGFTNPLQLISDIVTEVAPSDTTNRVYGVAFILHEQWTLRNCVWLGFNQASGAGLGFGIYDLSTLDALVTTYFDSATVLNTPTLNTLTPTTIGPGVFSFNWAASNSALIGPTMLIAPPSGGQEPYMFEFYNLGTVGGMVYAANPMAANVMPANLGSLTNCTGSENISVPMCKWTP
ncbi:MAG TPA: hypothetical protein VNY51_10150 [Candidatus Dormibacteraeota bacterium]|jgi:hypothetical protein|nr:hypothetical protein [Candidatus Dormibacteraeota bacterium]